MSIKVSSLVWEIGPKERNQRFVLLALADNSGDDGHCFPSITTIADKCLFTPRYVMAVIQELERDGWMRVERRKNGKGNCYQIDVIKLQDLSHEMRSREKRARAKASRENSSREIQSRLEVKSDAISSEIQRTALLEEPSRTVKEPPKAQEKESLPEWLDPILWAGWVEMRKRMRNAPFTYLARRSILADLAKLKSYGGDPNRRLEDGIKKGWRGVLFDSDRPINGNGNHTKPKSQYELDAEQQMAEKAALRREMGIQ